MEEARRFQVETEGLGDTSLGWREFVGSSLRSAEYDAAPSGQTGFQDLENRGSRELRNRTQVARELQAEAEGARHSQAGTEDVRQL